jgi:hypothetical protein
VVDLGIIDTVTEKSRRRRGRRWKDLSRPETYGHIQSQVLFWALYAVAAYLVAANVGVWTAVLVFGGGLLVAAVATFAGLRLRRRRDRAD